MSLLSSADLMNKVIIEVGCGASFPSRKFYMQSLPKSVTAFELRPHILGNLEPNLSYVVDEKLQPLTCEIDGADFLIMSKVFNQSNQEKGILIETKRGAVIKMSKAEKALIRRKTGIRTSTDGLALVKAVLAWVLKSEQEYL